MDAKRSTVEIAITPERVVELTAAPSDLFAVVRGLMDQGYEPEIRYEDAEVGGKTCWQPMQSKKAA